MFTTIDKALAAAVMAIIFLINNLTNFHFAVSEELVNTIAALVTPAIVYFVPNKGTTYVAPK